MKFAGATDPNLGFLSTRYPSPLVHIGREYKTVAEAFRACPSQVQKDLERREEVMRELIHAKFQQNPRLRMRMMAIPLSESGVWRDSSGQDADWVCALVQRYRSSLRQDHYNQIDKTVVERSSLVQWNNAVKSVLTSIMVPPGSTVIDLCAGKGGDLHKYKHAQVQRLLMLDVAEASIQEAKRRYENSSQNTVSATFLVQDCFVPFHHKEWVADVVACHFAIHYAFESPEKVSHFLANAARHLKPDGTLLLTFPREDKVRTFADTDTCSVTFSGSDPSRYTFFLRDCVHHVEEYVVPIAQLKHAAERHGFQVEQHHMFSDLPILWKNQPLWNTLTRRLAPLSHDDQAVFELYQWMLMRKTN